MTQSDNYKKGVAVRKRLRGEEGFAKNEADYAKDPMTKAFIDHTTDAVFGGLWARPGLDIKTRTLICVVSDAATGRYPELEIHLRFALKEGWTEEELFETLLHLSGYVGLPLIREALLVAKDVFAEERKHKKKSKK